ncbi:MAG: thymidylate kinase-like protein, partial [Nitrospiraceae bacterium]
MTAITSVQQASACALERLFITLDRAEIPWCVLHGYESLPREIRSDVDCLVAAEAMPPASGLLTAVRRGCQDSNAQVVQWLQHEATAHYLVIATKTEAGALDYLRFDVSSDYRRNGRVFYDGQEILEHRRHDNGFWVPAPRHEFGYYLVKKIAKGDLTAAHGERLSQVYRQDPAGCAAEIRRFWGEPSARLLERAASSGDWAEVQTKIVSLRRELLRRAGFRNPVSTVRYAVGESRRTVRRWLRPTGVWVVLLGPDGSGKSTVATASIERLRPAFRRTAQFHVLPRLFRKKGDGTVVTDPHGQAPRSRLA